MTAGYLLETIGSTGAVLVLSGVMLLTALGATVSPTVRHAPP